MFADANQTCYDDQFIAYTNSESLCYMPETNTMLYVNYTSFKKKGIIKQMSKLYSRSLMS